MAPAADPVGLREQPAPLAVREIDFTRPRVCLLGLPHDPISLCKVVERPVAAAAALRSDVTAVGIPARIVARAEPVGPASKTPA